MTVTAPPGFEDLTGPQRVLVDVYMAGVRVGEASAEVEPGHFRFLDAGRVVEILPEVADRARVKAALSAPDLDPHPEALCPPTSTAACSRPLPEVAAVIFDAARYRVEILVNPRFLTVRAATRQENLTPPVPEPGLVNFLSGTVSGTRGRDAQYYLQDTAIVGIGGGRIRANLQQSSSSGLVTDTLVAELDRPGLRYTAGTFWIPGTTLLDRTKLVGLGLSTQFDTRLDRDQLTGSPLILFLDQRARVDILVNGNILSSLLYDAGNQALDTSALPEGSYTVTLRVTAPSGRVHDEQRFFSRSSTLPMLGHDAFFVYAGALVRNSDGLVGDISRTPLFQAGWARRLRTALSVNLGVIGTGRRQWAGAGSTVLHHGWQLDTSILVSNRSGLGIFGHLARTATGKLSVDLDARHVSNPGGGPLLAATSVVVPAAGGLQYTLYSGAYTQFSGTLGYRIGQGRLSLVGTYRRQPDDHDYSLGPSIYLPLKTWRQATLDFNGTYAVTSTGRRAYFGVNLTVSGSRTTYAANAGGQFGAGNRGWRNQAQLGLTVSRRFDDVLGAQIQADGGAQHTNGVGYADAQIRAHSALADGNINVVQPFGGGAAQFAASAQTAIVMGKGGVRFNAGRNGDATVVVHVDAEQPGATFEVLVDNRVMGITKPGGDLTIALPSYRAYAVRIRALGEALSDYDTHSRQVSLYPGTVAWLDWNARRVVAVFGRLIQPDGTPLADAEISTASGELAQSDEKGHFLVQTGRATTLTVRARGGFVCKVQLDVITPIGDYAMVGDQVCRTLAGPPADLAYSTTVPSPTPKVSP